jgi:hypothetical protein
MKGMSKGAFMKSRVFTAFAVLLMLTSALPTSAAIGTIDQTSAATLLLPHFEVDPQPNGLTTVFRIGNASATATLVHVTTWTDLGYPTLVFDIYLTGYDVEGVNLADIFTYGVLPVTADAAHDPGDGISPVGPLSLDRSFAGCDDSDDYGYGDDGPLWGLPPPVPALSQEALADLVAAHTGQASVNGTYMPAGRAAAVDHGDQIMRGFVTMDVVTQCSRLRPTDAGYFVTGGLGVAGNDNVLFGEVFVIDRINSFMQSESLVPIEASTTHRLTSASGVGEFKYTFYSTFLQNPGSAADHREPLPTTWAVPYRGESPQTPELQVWRDPGTVLTPFDPSAVGSLPLLSLTQGLPFDSEEEPGAPFGDDSIPFVSGVVQLDGVDGPVLPHRQGWVFLNLNAPGGVIRQSWVSGINTSRGLYSNSRPGVQLSNAASGQNPILSTAGN